MCGDGLFGHMASVYVAVAVACGHRAYLLLFLHLRVFLFWGGMHSYHQFFSPRCWRPLRASSPSSRPGPPVVDLCPVGCVGGVSGGSIVFAGAGWVVGRVFLSHALFRPLINLRRPSCLFTLVRFFRWRRPWAVLFSIPGGVWPPLCFCAPAFSYRFFLPSSPFIPFCFFAASHVCMYSVALHTLLCLRRPVCGCVVLKLVRTRVAIFGSLGVCIYLSASRHWLISYSPIHLT